jgi:hypothetical protein
LYTFIIKKEIEIIFLSLGWLSNVVIRFQSVRSASVLVRNAEAAARRAMMRDSHLEGKPSQ